MKSLLQRIMTDLSKGVLGGLVVSLGVSAYIASKGSDLGVLAVALSFFAVYVLGFAIYTDMLCNIPGKKIGYTVDVAVVALGNMITAYGIGKLFLLTGRREQFRLIAQSFCHRRLSYSLTELLISAVLCGAAIAVGALGYNKFKNKTAFSIIIPTLFIALIVLAKLDHSLIDIVSFTLARVWCMDSVKRILMTIVGNLIGSTAIILIYKLTGIDKSNA